MSIVLSYEFSTSVGFKVINLFSLIVLFLLTFFLLLSLMRDLSLQKAFQGASYIVRSFSASSVSNIRFILSFLLPYLVGLFLIF